MENLVDITKLKTVANMSYDLRLSVPTVYNKIKMGEIKSIVIDGVTFCLEEGRILVRERNSRVE